jgi:conjugal transfer pilus assembly protein TraB
MSDLKALAPAIIKKKQYLLLSLIAGVLVFVACVVVFMDESSNKIATEESKPKGGKRIEISKLANGVDASHRWVDISESAQKELAQKLEAQEAINKELESKVADLTDTFKKNEEQQDNSSLDILAAELGRLREELEVLRRGNEISSSLTQQEYPVEPMSQIQKIHNHELKLEGSKLKHYSLQHYIPPASFAPAVVISGVDASVGVQAQGEPRPMLFRITGKARSAAANGKVQEADIVGCTVTGAATGDLSSERVFIRLLKMTCSREDDKVFETEIHGYVAGVGKAGIRGDVVSREGDFVFKSFLAGIASGAGNGISQKFASPMALPSGLATTQPTATDIVNSSVGAGISNSSNKLSDYLIKRAEQYQPVISVPAGIDVEIVFNDGVYIDGRGEVDENQAQQ